jgi:hypothetical protein
LEGECGQGCVGVGSTGVSRYELLLAGIENTGTSLKETIANNCEVDNSK